MALIKLSEVFTFVREYLPASPVPGQSVSDDQKRAEYSSIEAVFDTATLTTASNPGNGADINIFADAPPTDFYLDAGEIHSYCTGTTRNPWVCNGQGGANARPVEANSVACGAPVPVPGCTNALAINYDPLATVDNGSCVLPTVSTLGCTNPRARNYNAAATQDDGTCVFGSIIPVVYNYSTPASVVVVFNEALDLFVTEQTYRPQMLVPIEGKGLFTLPLPGQSGDAPVQRYLWQHNAAPEVNSGGGLRLYGRQHPVWVEVVVLGSGVHTVKTVDNFVLVSNDPTPYKVDVTAPEQGIFTQQFIQSGNPVADTVRRHEQLTYGVIVPPQDKAWGGRVRGKWARLRFFFTGQHQARLSNLLVLLRESVS